MPSRYGRPYGSRQCEASVPSDRNTRSPLGPQNGLSVSTRASLPLIVASEGVPASRLVLSRAWAPLVDDRTSAACSSTPVDASVPAAMMPAGAPSAKDAHDTVYTPRSSSAPPASAGFHSRLDGSKG